MKYSPNSLWPPQETLLKSFFKQQGPQGSMQDQRVQTIRNLKL